MGGRGRQLTAFERVDELDDPRVARRLGPNAQILIARIEGRDHSEPRRIIFPTHLIMRATTGPASV